MNTIKLNCNEIEEKIEAGNNCNGNYVLAVAPDGSDHRVYWMESNRQWNPWPDSWHHIIGIPAVYPYGEGSEYETACDCLRANGLNPNAIEDEIEESREFGALVEYAEAKFPEWMEAAKVSQVSFLVDAFLDACNGDGNDLSMLSPWGYAYDDEYSFEEKLAPPAKFEYE